MPAFRVECRATASRTFPIQSAFKALYKQYSANEIVDMQKERPLSPHLLVYRPQITTMLSILHRGTGVFLSLGSPLLIFWLLCLASGHDAYEHWLDVSSMLLVKLFMLAWTFAVFYHLSNGIRHLFWDVGQGYELDTLYKSGYAVVASAFILTSITVVIAASKGVFV